MQIQLLEEEQAGPFQIIHNARSTRAPRSRKSSVSVVEKEGMVRGKKTRKMTLNPESVLYEQIKEIEELHQERTAAHSARNDPHEDELNIDDFLDLGWPKKMQSEKEMELESGIAVGIGSERELDYDFQLGRTVHKMDLQFQME